MKSSVLIVGGGISGIAAAKLAVLLEYKVTLADRRPENIATIQHVHIVHEEDIDPNTWPFALIIVSPGVPRNNPLISAAIEQEITIISELNFASNHLNIPIVAVTGTNGKSSTVWYTQQLATQLGYKAFLGGNFGTPLSDLVVAQYTQKLEYDIAIVEVSSYQLEWSHNFSPVAAGILNLTPDHLARHKTMREYRRCKMKIFDNQSSANIAIVPLNDPTLHPSLETQLQFFGSITERTDEWGCFYDDTHFFCIQSDQTWSMPISEIPLLGRHNLENIAMATLLLLGIANDLSVSPLHIAQLRALEHRLESISIQDRLWINDSKATNLEATLAALNSINTSTVILLGGAGKEGADYSRLLPLLNDRAQAVICFGSSGSIIYTALQPISKLIPIKLVVDLSSAIELARLEFAPHPVLLSPACASFDEFANFAERGRYFKETIQELEST